MKYKESYSKELITSLLKISADEKLFHAFLKDILTPQEYKAIAIRWEIIKQLNSGKDQRSIAKDLGIGIATVTRGSRELQKPQGAFQKVLQFLKKKN